MMMSHQNKRKWSEVLCLTLFLFLSAILSPLTAQTTYSDSLMLAAYDREDMTVWQKYVDELNSESQTSINSVALNYMYGYCSYIVDRDKTAALPYVKQFRAHIEAAKNQLPIGHYEMYMSAVMVYELRLHVSMRPVKAMSLAKEATRLAPTDPLVLSYYGTSLFYAPKPFGSKSEALEWFTKADRYFQTPQYKYCWVRKATQMYISQCKDKLKKQ